MAHNSAVDSPWGLSAEAFFKASQSLLALAIGRKGVSENGRVDEFVKCPGAECDTQGQRDQGVAQARHSLHISPVKETSLHGAYTPTPPHCTMRAANGHTRLQIPLHFCTFVYKMDHTGGISTHPHSWWILLHDAQSPLGSCHVCTADDGPVKLSVTS